MSIKLKPYNDNNYSNKSSIIHLYNDDDGPDRKNKTWNLRQNNNIMSYNIKNSSYHLLDSLCDQSMWFVWTNVKGPKIKVFL